MYTNPFTGRMNRKNFIHAQLLLIVVVFIVGLYIFHDGVTLYTIDRIIPLLVFATIPQLAFCARRLHDLNHSGYWAVLILTPYLSLLFALYISLRPGTVTANKYGEADTRNLRNSLLNTT